MLDADVAANHGALAAHDASRLSTDRIQHALDPCPAGQAVVLRARRNKSELLTGPLMLRTGVTLMVDANTALVALRNPRLYDLTLGSCGVVAEKGHGCKQLITGDATAISSFGGLCSIR